MAIVRRLLLSVLLFSGFAHAGIVSQEVEYMDEGVQLQGVMYWNDSVKVKRPGVLVYHEWWGLNEQAQRRARMLAEEGYVTFAPDMYGKGKVTNKADQASEWMQGVVSDNGRWLQRAIAALDQLKGFSQVDPMRIAAIGYGFGGSSALQMAFTGEDLKGVVSFHGSLPAVPEVTNLKVKSSLLLLQGRADTFISPEVVANFQARLEDAGIKWEMDAYGGVRHGFTNPDADQYGIENLKYDPLADQRSWARTQAFLNEVFGEKAKQ